jgi:IMP dehydrogenase
VTDLNQPVSVYMTPKERLVTAREGESRDVVFAKMARNALKKRWLWMQTTCAA